MKWRSVGVLLAVGSGLLIPCAAAASVTTIAGAIERALDQHSELRQASLSLRLAELELDATLATFGLPSLTFQIEPPSLTLEGLSGDASASLSGGVSLPLGSSAQLSGSLGLSWDIEAGSWALDGWSLKYSQKLDLSQPSSALSEIERNRDAVAGSLATLNRARNTIALSTMESYSQLLSDAAAVDQAAAQLLAAQEVLRSTERLADEGLKAASSLNEARLDVLEAEIRLDKLRASYERELESFARETLRTTEPPELAPFELAVETLRDEAERLIARDDVIDDAVAASTSVLSAADSVEDAREELASVLREVLPDLSIEAGYTNGTWAIGGTISFDFFSPDRGDRIEIARTNLALTEEKLADAESQARNSLLDRKAALVDSLHDIGRLALEQEKWTLEEQVMSSRYEAGTIAEADWDDFVLSEEAFGLEVAQRETALLLAYLRYRDVLGLELGWEEWLQ